MGDTQLQPTVLCRMTHKKRLTEKELADVKEAFAVFDRNGDGRITKLEIRQVLESLGQHPTDRDIDGIIGDADTDGNGSIDLHEFISMMKKKKNTNELKEEEREMAEAFRVFDADGDGYVTAEELRQVMERLGESLTNDEVKAMILAADMDGDGRVDFGEFVKLMHLGQR